MRVLTSLIVVSTVIILGHAEFRYKIRGPPPPPLPPKPPVLLTKPPSPYYSKTKYHFSSGPRIVSSHLRGPPIKHYLEHSPYQFHSPIPLHLSPKPAVQPSSIAHKSPPKIILSTSFKEPFRLPVTLKESFPSSPSLTLEYHTPSKSSFMPSTLSPSTFHSISINDDKGPIHTIPAPNLGPSSKPFTSSHSSPVLNSPLESSGLTSNNIISQSLPALSLNAIQLEEQVPVAIAFNPLPSSGYQVHEQTHDHSSHDVQGKPVYYAPDPDPSIPAPKIPPTSDPHSHPSNGKSKEELLFTHAHAQSVPPQIFETQTDVNNPTSLTSQDLFHLLQGNVQGQQLIENYGVPLVAQPQYQQHFIHHVPALPVFHQAAPIDNSIGHHQNFQAPQFHSFNYQETQERGTPTLSGSNHYSSSVLNNFHDDVDNDDEEGAESAPVPTYAQSDKAAYPSQSDVKNFSEEASKETKEQQKKDVPESFYTKVAQSTQLYTTLPNREAAEALATLQAAGNINSNFISKLNEVKSEGNSQSSEEASAEDEYSDEDSDDDYEESQPNFTHFPQNHQSSTTRYSEQKEEIAKHQLSLPSKSYSPHSEYGSSQNAKDQSHFDSHEESKDQNDTEFSEQEQQFGARIRPK